MNGDRCRLKCMEGLMLEDVGMAAGRRHGRRAAMSPVSATDVRGKIAAEPS